MRSTGALSPMGDAVAILPPMVARLRMPREANARSILAREGYSGAIDSSIAVSVAAPPICHAAAVRWIRVSSGIPSVEISRG